MQRQKHPCVVKIVISILGFIELVNSCLAPPPKPPVPFSCGRAPTDRDGHRIVGGSDAEPNSIPWQAGIASLWSLDLPYCGATIISPYHLLTSAHCVVIHTHGPWWFPDSFITIGEHYVKERNDTTFHAIECVHYHPDFNATGLLFENDFALITLKDPLDLTSQDSLAKAACLPEPNLSFNSESVFTISGWGFMNETVNENTTIIGNVSDWSETLQTAQVPWYDHDLCNENYYEAKVNYSDKLNYSAEVIPEQVITDSMICAGYDDGRIDYCLGDGGGPMTWTNPNTQEEILIGIASLHFGCGRENLPGIYAKVAAALDFVRMLGVDQERGEATNICPCVGLFCIG